VSPTPFIGQDAAVDCAASHRPLGLRLFGAPPPWSRPVADVERSYSICVCFKAAPNALKIVMVSPIVLVDEPAAGARLRGVSRADGLYENTSLCSFMLEGELQKAIGHAVNEFSRTLPPLASTLSKILEMLDDNVGIEPFRQLDKLACDLPASSPCVVPLSSTKQLKLLSGLTFTVCVSINLELRPSSLESRLHPRQVLPQVELPQHFALSAQDGHGNSAAVDVHPEHVQALSLRWRFFSQDGEELEVLTHDHGAYPPAIFEMCQHTMPSPISSYRKTYSCEVRTNAQSWVASLGALEAKKATVEPHNRAFDVRSGFTNPPCVASSLAHELGGDTESLSVFVIDQTVQFSAVFKFICFEQSEAFLSHLKKGAVSFLQLRPFDGSQGKQVEHEAFSHGYQARLHGCYLSAFGGEVAESIRPQSLLALENAPRGGEQC